MDTPYLITDGRLRERAEDPSTLSRRDLLSLIYPFVRCCYPRSAERLKPKYEKLPTERLTILFDTGGAFYKFTQSLTSSHVFQPPQWTLIPATPGPDQATRANDVEAVQKQFLPITRMGMETAEFRTLPPTQQKFIALTTLPSTLSEIANSSDVVNIMAKIGLTPEDEIFEDLQSAELIRLVGEANAARYAFTPAPTSKPTLLDRNRYKFRHSGRGDPWKSPGEVLRLWLEAVLPPLHAAKHTLTLTRRPIEKSHDDIDLTAPSLPTAAVLDHYTYDTKMERGALVQFEFWFTTSTPDMGSGRTRPAFPGDKRYFSKLTQHSMSLMRMESCRTDMVPCIMLLNSAVRDSDSDIKSELIGRLPAGQEAAHLFEIQWHGIHTTSLLNVMAKCVMTTEQNFTQVTTRFGSMARGDARRHPVSYDYGVTLLPLPIDSKCPDISGALTLQRRFHEDMTYTYLYGMDGLNPFTLVPLRSHLPDTPTTEMNFLSIAQLLMTGRLKDNDGALKPSPVVKVSTNEEGSRCFLHSRKVDAARLIRYTAQVAILLPRWIGGDIEIRQNTTEADKVIRSGRTLDTPATKRPPQQTPFQTNKLPAERALDPIDGLRERNQAPWTTPTYTPITPLLGTGDTPW